MMHRDMTRKEFLSALLAFFGLAILSRLPFVGGTKQIVSAPSSYGNHTYGGAR